MNKLEKLNKAQLIKEIEKISLDRDTIKKQLIETIKKHNELAEKFNKQQTVLSTSKALLKEIL